MVLELHIAQELHSSDLASQKYKMMVILICALTVFHESIAVASLLLYGWLWMTKFAG